MERVWGLERGNWAKAQGLVWHAVWIGRPPVWGDVGCAQSLHLPGLGAAAGEKGLKHVVMQALCVRWRDLTRPSTQRYAPEAPGVPFD